MAKRNLIIGGSINYGINQLKPWVMSAKEVAGDNTDVVLICGNTSKETIEWLDQQGVFTVDLIHVPNVPIHVLRFLSIYDYLKDNSLNYEYVVTTDVKDVYFQKDPFELIDFIVKGSDFKLIVASEGLKYKDEPWGDDNLKSAYGAYIYEQFKDNEIYNVGTFGGSSDYVKDMVFHIFSNGTNRPIPIVDQAVFNVLCNTLPFSDVVYPTDDWAAELGTIMDPSKINYFRPNLTCEEPVLKDGLLYYKETNELFPIVHQYDRVPELKKIVQEKYGQEDESQYFIYKT